VPLPAPASIPPEGFCQRNEQGHLLVNVHNQGGFEAAASKTRIIFDGTTPADFDTPAIAAGTSTTLVIPIPDGCFDVTTQQCKFTIGVDATSAVAESNETNNNAAGLCGLQFQ
jgi:subtilase family serine protease